MNTYRACSSFNDNRLGDVKKNQELPLAEEVAKPYELAGLLKNTNGSASTENPIPAAGTALSALPAAQASPPVTAPPPKRGRKKKAAEVSSS